MKSLWNHAGTHSAPLRLETWLIFGNCSILLTEIFLLYSHVHKSYPRIDYFLISSELIPNISNSTYHNLLISDHSPISLQFKGILSKPKYTWLFNPLLLNDPLTEHMTACIDEFHITNDNWEVSDFALWEAFKAVMRGHIISFESSKKRELNSRLRDIDKMLPALEETNRSSILQSD